MYCGCGTSAGKCRWISVIALVLFGIGMWIMYGVEVVKCDVCDKVDGGEPTNCKPATDNPSQQIDGDTQVLENCSVGTLLAGFFLGIIAFAAASIPCFVMCCCAKGPESTQFHNGAPVVATAYNPQAEQAATPYTGPPVGNTTPYMAPPGHDYNASKPTV